MLTFLCERRKGMCDQLSTLGIEFNISRMESTILSDLRYSAAHPYPFAPVGSSIIPRQISNLFKSGAPLPWGAKEVFRPSASPARRDSAECDRRDVHPPERLTAKDLLERGARPWGLGQIRYPTSVTVMAGKSVRRPGLFMRVDEDTNEDTSEPLLNTNETIHSSVRVRLVCRGLSCDDKETWKCESLRDENGKPLWVLERGSGFDEPRERKIREFVPRELIIAPDEYRGDLMYPSTREDTAWRWKFVGNLKEERNPDRQVPHSRIMAEEPMVGFWERYLLGMLVAGGPQDVWRFGMGGLPERW